jgi:hypothetical protein
MQCAFAILHDQLSEVSRPSFGSNGPENIGQISKTKTVGRRQIIDVGVNFEATGFALDFGFALNLR